MRLIKVLLLLLFFSNSLFALEFKQKGNRILLYGDSCEEVFKMVKAIHQWQSSYSDGGSTKGVACKYSQLFAKWGHHADITDILPKWFKDNYKKFPVKSGPNCWNLALYATKFLPFLRYTPAGEVSFYLDSKLCQLRKSGEEPRPGDIIAIRKWHPKERYVEEIHGFIYIARELSFSKNGHSKTRPYALYDNDAVFRAYSVNDSSCMKLQGPPESYPSGSKERNCKVYAQYYGCSSLNDFLDKNSTSEELKAQLAIVEEYECKISRQAMLGQSAGNVYKLMEASLYVVYELNKQELQSSKLSEADKFLLQTIQFRIIGILAQLRMNEQDE